MDQYEELRKHTIENATLLWTLAEVPEKPAESTVYSVDGEWTLPINRKVQLTEELTFIASSKDGSKEIMAVCLEEGADKVSMVIRVASNAGNLLRMVQNLQGVADLMARATRRGI